MDVMQPDLLWLGDRCYRLPMSDSSYENHQKFELNEGSGFDDSYYSDRKNYDDEEEISDIDNHIETLPNNRFQLHLQIPQIFCSKIIGAKGVTKKRIENDTNTTIIIPRPTENSDVVIKGSSKRNIVLANKNIDIIISSARQKLVSTHFISVPMNCEEIKQNFISFKEQVLKKFYSDRGVDESIFQNPDKLHLTIGTLVLVDQKERILAAELLNEVYENSIKFLVEKNKNNVIEMRGIEYMNDDPAEVDVLYGKINANADGGIIQKIADVIVHHFIHHKLLKSDEREHVKLHVTLMNTLFREEEFDELNVEVDNFNKIKSGRKVRRTFNAINILKNFHDFYFGKQELQSIQLSLRFSSAKDGYYKSSHVININCR